jgi:hypothetical protein
MTESCLHLHFSRIANMDLGEFHSSPTQGVFRCEECRNIFIVRDIRPYQIKAVYGEVPEAESWKSDGQLAGGGHKHV